MSNLTDLHEDDANLNQHTARGTMMLRQSVRRFKARGAGIVDANNTIVHGNNRAKVFAEEGLTEVEVFDVEPGVPVFIQYDDLDLSDPATRELSIVFNRTEEVGIDLSTPDILELAGKRDLGYLYNAEEMLLLRDLAHGAPSMDELRAQHGDSDLRDLWPTIRIIIPKAAYDVWLELLQQAPGIDDAERAGNVLLAMSLEHDDDPLPG